MSPTTTAAPDTTTSSTSARRLTAAALVAAGAGFVLFPVLRPWPDEAQPTAALAAAFASDRWVVAHLCGILAIGLLADHDPDRCRARHGGRYPSDDDPRVVLGGVHESVSGRRRSPGGRGG